MKKINTTKSGSSVNSSVVDGGHSQQTDVESESETNSSEPNYGHTQQTLSAEQRKEYYTSQKLRDVWFAFFESKNHVVIPSASLIPQDDPTVLFTTAGMHPLVPYLLGQPHPSGKRLANVQVCVRTGDIEEVGDDSHCTFFEMLGNWSLGDYFKRDAIGYSFEFLTTVLGLSMQDIAVSVFAGDADSPRDEESAQIWQSLGLKQDQIFYLPKINNWWGPAGRTGPCGPDTEMFFVDQSKQCTNFSSVSDCNPSCDCGRYLEIWNNVFMQYFKDSEGSFVPLTQKNVDTGMGLERTLVVLNGMQSVYDTDVFLDSRVYIEQASGKRYGHDKKIDSAIRIVLDHIRTATFMIGDPVGIVPSNTEQGYVLRRLLRRAIRYCQILSLPADSLSSIAKIFVNKYKHSYPYLHSNIQKIIKEIDAEQVKFGKAIVAGIREFDKLCASIDSGTIDGSAAFRLYDTYGFPLEMTQELAKERGMSVDIAGYHQRFAQHQAASQVGAEQKFRGGLADSSTATTYLHTATHLLHQALKIVLDSDKIGQKGSNITAERLRFDFSFDRPMTKQEIQRVQDIVNEAIAADVPITHQEMTVGQAKDSGAIGLFGDRYSDIVKVYDMGKYSREICGGPHAVSTGQLGLFEIVKEQSSSSGVRRIKAVLK